MTAEVTADRQVGHWTPKAALAYIAARPGDSTADEIIRDLCRQIDPQTVTTLKLEEAK